MRQPGSPCSAGDDEVVIVLQVIVGVLHLRHGQVTDQRRIALQYGRDIVLGGGFRLPVENADSSSLQKGLERVRIDLFPVLLEDIRRSPLKDSLHTKVIEGVAAINAAVRDAVDIQCAKATVQYQRPAVDVGFPITGLHRLSVASLGSGEDRADRLVEDVDASGIQRKIKINPLPAAEPDGKNMTPGKRIYKGRCICFPVRRGESGLQVQPVVFPIAAHAVVLHSDAHTDPGEDEEGGGVVTVSAKECVGCFVGVSGGNGVQSQRTYGINLSGLISIQDVSPLRRTDQTAGMFPYIGGEAEAAEWRHALHGGVADIQSDRVDAIRTQVGTEYDFAFCFECGCVSQDVQLPSDFFISVWQIAGSKLSRI